MAVYPVCTWVMGVRFSRWAPERCRSSNVEHLLGMQVVAGSSPADSTIIRPTPLQDEARPFKPNKPDRYRTGGPLTKEKQAVL